MGEKPTSSMARTNLDADDDCGGVRPDIMAMCLRLLAMYMRQLMLDTDDGQTAAAGIGRRRATAVAADSCGARLRDGSPCLRPPVEGRRRCRSHGCAPRAGAPKGNRNALKHGCFTAKEIAKGRRISEFIRECRETMQAARRNDRERASVADFAERAAHSSLITPSAVLSQQLITPVPFVGFVKGAAPAP